MYSPTSYTYPVAHDGYEWIEAVSTEIRLGPVVPERWLTDGVPSDARWGQRLYEPMEHPALFRVFADTSPDEEGVKAFANRFGLLGFPSNIVLPEGHRFAGQHNLAEPLHVWQAQIRLLRATLDVWDALQDRDVEALRQLFTVTLDDTRAEVSLQGDRSVLFLMDVPIDIASDLARIALAYVQRTLNLVLENSVTPNMVNAPPDGLKIQWTPSHLLGTLWLQFALAVDGRKRFKACAQCGTWFEITVEGSRASKQYCSDACRMRAYRTRSAARARNE